MNPHKLLPGKHRKPVEEKGLFVSDNAIDNYDQDKFGQRHIADIILETIKQTKPPFTIGIFGGWGTGKSSLLKMIDGQIKNEKGLISVTIDAWNYSSAEKLRRAFLIHVTKKLTQDEKIISRLNEQLFTKTSEVVKKEDQSFFDNEKLSDKRLSEISSFLSHTFLRFLLFCIPLLLIIFVLDLLGGYFSAVFTNNPFILLSFFSNYDWPELINKFEKLLFIPLILATFKELPIQILPKQVTVEHERIDADELFVTNFDEVIEQASGDEGKKIVIFVDNLDRLQSGKIIEALESLKTYLSNDHCIFIVACDDQVIRNIINDGNKVGQNANGEHYLDKFFQQTFRLPEYLDFDLHEFAYLSLKSTTIFDELIDKGVNIDTLISFLLPTDIHSPRKVKKLLNEFISLYQMASRKESKEFGKLPPGKLSNNVIMLGKFSTIRAEYPDFYRLLIKHPSILRKITDGFSSNGTIIEKSVENETQTHVNVSDESFLLETSLVEYLRKTKSIPIADLESLIYLSQDVYSKNIDPELFEKIHTLLSDGNTAEFQKLINNIDDETEKRNALKSSSNLLAFRLPSGAKTNGAKVIANVLPGIENDLRQELANIIYTILNESRISEFSIDELFNTIRWSNIPGEEVQKEKIADYVITLLAQEKTRQKAIEQLFENFDLFSQSNLKRKFADWKTGFFDIIKKINSSNLTPEEKKKLDECKDIMSWLVEEEKKYIQNDQIFEVFYSDELLMIVSSLFSVETSDDSKAYAMIEIVDILTKSAKSPSQSFWYLVKTACTDANELQDLIFIYDLISSASFSNYPNELINVYDSIYLSLSRLSTFPDFSSDEKINAFNKGQNSIGQIRNQLPKDVSFTSIPNLPNSCKKLLLSDSLSNVFCEYIKNNISFFISDEARVILDSLIDTFSTIPPNNGEEKQLLDLLISANQHLSDQQRENVIKKIDEYVKSIDDNKLVDAKNIIENIHQIESYQNLLSIHSTSYLLEIKIENPYLVNLLSLCKFLILLGLLDRDALINKLADLIPFKAEGQIIESVFALYNEYCDKLQKETKVKFCSLLLEQWKTLSSFQDKTLSVCSSAIENCSQDQINQFIHYTESRLPQSFPTTIPIIDKTIHLFSIENQIKLIIGMFSIEDLSNENKSLRNALTNKILQGISRKDKLTIIQKILDGFAKTAIGYAEILNIVKRDMSRSDLLSIRKKSIDNIKSSDEVKIIIKNLHVILYSYRDDLHEIQSLVDLFVYLFSKNEEIILNSLEYAGEILSKLNLTKEYQYELAENLAHAYWRINKPDLRELFQKSADRYLRHWNPDNLRQNL